MLEEATENNVVVRYRIQTAHQCEQEYIIRVESIEHANALR